MPDWKVRRAPVIHTELTVPGDKSISHRAIMLASMSNGTCVIRGFLPSEDCLCTVAAMRALGIKIENPEPDTIVVYGNKRTFQVAERDIYCGNSGTTMRLLAGILAGQPFRSRLTGDPSLSKRPMRRVIDPLTQMGASIRGEGSGDRPPLVIEGGPLKPIHYFSPVASAQVKSAILLAGMFANGKTTVTEPSQSRDHSERMLEYFLVRPIKDELSISIYGGQTPESRDFMVPGDISSAAFWLVAAAAQPSSHLLVRNVGLNETRTGILGVLVRMGAAVREVVENDDAEPLGTIEIRGDRLKGTTIAGKEIPNVIDELPILAVAGALAYGKTVIADAGELRVKETDRLAAIATNLRAMGAQVSETEDGMEIVGGVPLHGARVQSFGDHRIAMAFAIAGLFAEGETIIEDTECVATSYPGFENALEKIMSTELKKKTPGAGHHDSAGIVNAARPHIVIAIDGPAASGKSSVARALARRLSFAYVNTGAMYRAATWLVVSKNIAPDDAEKVQALLQSTRITCGLNDGESTILMDGANPSEHLVDESVNANVSAVSSIPEVRRLLVEKQRAYAADHDLVMEGRDIGSVVFPETPYKFYVDASPEVRAMRRARQGLADSIAQRDKFDSSRRTSPLIIAEDAHVIDSSNLTVDGVVGEIIGRLKQKGLEIVESPALVRPAAVHG